MTKDLCVYRIPEAPYFAISSIYKIFKNKCIIEDTKGKLRSVEPLYVGPIDSVKLMQYGNLVSEYIRSLSDMQSEVKIQMSNIFNVVPATT